MKSLKQFLIPIGVLVLTIFAVNIQTFAQGQGDSGTAGTGGEYRTFTARQWIMQAANELLPQVEFSASRYFDQIPGSRQIVLSALQNLELQPKVSRQRNGDELILDYDLSKGRIIFLKEFFNEFSVAVDPKLAVSAIKDLMLHETGHLISLTSDEAAENFAQDVAKPSYLPVAIDPQDICGTIKKLRPQFVDNTTMIAFNEGYNNICPGNVPSPEVINDRLCPLSSAIGKLIAVLDNAGASGLIVSKRITSGLDAALLNCRDAMTR